jgi:hypothetical protein
MYVYIDPLSLAVGALVGVVVLGLIGFIVFRIRVWGQKLTQPFKKQTVVHQTDKSPFEVMRESWCGCCFVLVLLALMAAGGLVMWVGCSPEV